jgi:hypothetical protein
MFFKKVAALDQALAARIAQEGAPEVLKLFVLAWDLQADRCPKARPAPSWQAKP